MALLDPHSYADDTQPSTRALELDLVVDFRACDLSGTATLQLDRPASGVLDLDTRGLAIQSIVGGDERPCAFELTPADPIKGSRLRILTNQDRLKIRYRTSASATALQWLEPRQTQGGEHPFMFTQCQAIHARSIVPCQDTPRVRVTYRARLDVPAALRAVMAAAHVQRKDIGGGRAVETFVMPQPIPTYLLALAVGHLASRELGPRSRVFAEPAMLDAAAFEFADVDAMLTTAESLFGPYAWDRFDLLLMPPSFPYGGMENPRLTFLTPTLLAKDRSLVSVVAHELAHSWTGNLVTNASMNDFWLNEGFTVFAERRIVEALEGPEAMAQHAALGRKHLDVDLERLSKLDPRFTRLENDLEGVHPDDVYSLVPYEKGYLFLRRIEQVVGREAFDVFLKKYIAHFRFRSITTADFLAFLGRELPAVPGAVDLEAWTRGTGIPADAPAVRSSRVERIEGLVAAWTRGERPATSVLRGFDASEWQLFLSSLPRRLDVRDCARLDDQFALGDVENAEIRVAWLVLAAASGYEPAVPQIRSTLLRVGRMKYLRPLYASLLGRGPEGRALAEEIFAQAGPSYHPVARALVAGMLSADA